MHRMTAPKANAAKPGRIAALHIANQRTSLDDTADDDSRLEALRRAFAGVGLTVHRMALDELAIIGPAFVRSVPGEREGWVLARQLRGGMA